ncbi:MAG: phage portal protein [Alphaproteobacteria bacterium]
MTMHRYFNALRHMWTTKSSRVAPIIALDKVGKPVWTPRRYDALAEEGYKKNVIVYRCVNLITRSAASVPWKLYRKNKEMVNHPLLDLLHTPNPRQGGAALIEAILGYKLLAGNSYIELVNDSANQPCELYALRPDRMKVIPGSAGVPKAYEYSVGERSQRIIVDHLTGASNILHLKTFNPLDDWYGMSPIEACAQAIDQHNAVSGHNLALLQNGGRPTGALKIKSSGSTGVLNDAHRQSLRDSIRESYEGMTNAGKMMILEGEFEWQEMGLSPKDLDFIDGKKLSAREIAQAYGVPTMLIGVPGDATFANYREARFHLWEDTVVPLLDHLCDEFNHWLVPRFGEGLRLKFDLEAIPALADRREKHWKRISEAGFLTLNEKRQALGYEPLAEGDTLCQNP